MVYYYKEGMAAPMGSFSNYGRRPRAVRVVDRSLREQSPGIYRTEARLRRFRYGIQVNSLGLTEQQPENNAWRILLETLGVTLSRKAP